MKQWQEDNQTGQYATQRTQQRASEADIKLNVCYKYRQQKNME